MPPAVASAHPDVEWKSLAGMRDKLVHDYFGVNMDILWDVVTTKLPTLLGQVDSILKNTK
jgi:uncharacterized protein with HEPN domain